MSPFEEEVLDPFVNQEDWDEETPEETEDTEEEGEENM